MINSGLSRNQNIEKAKTQSVVEEMGNDILLLNKFNVPVDAIVQIKGRFST